MSRINASSLPDHQRPAGGCAPHACFAGVTAVPAGSTTAFGLLAVPAGVGCLSRLPSLPSLPNLLLRPLPPSCSYNITVTHSMFAEVDHYRQVRPPSAG